MPKEITADLQEMFAAETVLVSGWTGQDFMGEDLYAAGVEYNCHIEGHSRLVRDATGLERVSTVQVYLDGAYNVSVKDKVLLPERFEPRDPPIITVERMTDENGPHHEVLVL